MGLFDRLRDFLIQRKRSQSAPAPAPTPPAPAPVVSVPASAPAPVKVEHKPLSECPETAPVWMKWAWKEIGQHEIGDTNRGPAIKRYVELAHAGDQGDPWCAIFANAALETSGIRGTRSASSQSFRNSVHFVRLDKPALGAIVVFWRGHNKDSGIGHVGFYVGERDGYIWTLGGNEDNKVQIEALAKEGHHFGLVGYYWPANVRRPSGGPVILTAEAPKHVVSVV